MERTFIKDLAVKGEEEVLQEFKMSSNETLVLSADAEKE